MNKTATGTLMPEWLRQRVRITPDRLALVSADERLSFAALDAAVDAVASRLRAEGVAAGDIVALLAGNSGVFVKIVHAVARLGAVLMPINVRLSQDEIEWQLKDSGARFLVYDGANAGAIGQPSQHTEVARTSGDPEPPDLEGWSIRWIKLEGLVPGGGLARPSRASGRTDFGSNESHLPTPSPPEALEGHQTREVLEISARPEVLEGRGTRELSERSVRPELVEGRAADTRVDLNTVQGIVYTSGTTGRPKGAMLTFGNHFWSATGSMLNLGLLAEDRWLACLPLFHVGGLSILFRSVICGMPAIVHESFDAERVNAAIEQERVTIVSVVSVMLERMLDARRDTPYPSHLRCLLLGGGPAPRQLLERCAAIGAPVVQTYGLTESASQVATLAPEDALRKLGSAGKPLFPAEVRVVREDGVNCDPEEAGEIIVRGPSITPGYLNRPDATALTLRDGWLHTGDIGYVDGEGYLYVLDRRDDLIISGGENVYPAELEGVLQSHPAVFEAGVIGVAVPGWGERPVAVVVLRRGEVATADELIGFCRERIAGYKAPSRVIIDSAPLPRNASGKLLRRELRQTISVQGDTALEAVASVDNSDESDKTPHS